MLKISLTKQAIEDMVFFASSQPKLLVKITQLFESISKSPFSGTGKPEPLKGDLSSYWSRRITQEHRLVYKVEQEKVTIIQCRFHYK
jgi:toxin YoeB